MGKIEFRFSILFVPAKVKQKRKLDVALPASMLRSNLFFVRVNRFWCVWIRALVDVFAAQVVGAEDWSGFFAMGCLT